MEAEPILASLPICPKTAELKQRIMSTPTTVTPSTHAATALFGRIKDRKNKDLFVVAGLSANGMLLFLIGFLVVGSGFRAMRPEVGGLALHPYLIPLTLAFPFVVLSRIGQFPMRILTALLVFNGMYFFSVVNGGSIAVGEIVKLGSGFLTIVTTTLLVRKRGDFVAGSLGLSIAVCLLAVVALREENKAGVEAIEGANKNSYSMFALPAVLLAGYICLHMQNVPVWVKGIFLACTLPSLAAIFMSGNRSGYLGAVLVGLMLFWGKRGRGLLLVGGITAAVAMWVISSGATKVFDQRMKQTFQGNESDDYRVAIIMACLEIGLTNPIIGVSPQRIGFEIGRRTSILHHYNVVDSHNVFAHIFAASGVICFSAMIAVGWAMWTYKPRDGKPWVKGDPLRSAWSLLRMLVVLWAIRGLFTRDILYNPSFNICFGLSIALCMLAETVRESTAKLGSREAMRGIE